MIRIFDKTTLTGLQKRLWLKAEAARWAAQRQQIIALNGTVPQQVIQQDRLLIAEANALRCDLWMMPPLGCRPRQSDDLDMIAACFETLTEAVGLVRSVVTQYGAQNNLVKLSLALMAEAQSALRCAVAKCGGYSDVDQEAIYEILLRATSQERIFLNEGMTLHDSIDPSMWVDITGRIFALCVELDKRRVQRSEDKKTLVGNRKQKVVSPAFAAPLGSDVRKVAALLRGKSLVMIGAEGTRLKAKEAIEKAFGLKELVWIETSPHDSYLSFEPQIVHTDVAAVLLLIRWASHCFGDVKLICDRYRKPLVRVKTGYNPNQIAAAIMSQASERLGYPKDEALRAAFEALHFINQGNVP
ncbi:MAG: hypothetical protein NTZ32_11450 [Planctomycetales bacterium]|nr:hypothetical protein [Planctomycetales bacterium]